MSQNLSNAIEQAYKSAQVEAIKETKEEKKLRILTKEDESKSIHEKWSKSLKDLKADFEKNAAQHSMAGLCLLVAGSDEKFKEVFKVDENSRTASFTFETKDYIESEESKMSEIRATRVNQMSLALFPTVTLGKHKVTNPSGNNTLFDLIRNQIDSKCHMVFFDSPDKVKVSQVKSLDDAKKSCLV